MWDMIDLPSDVDQTPDSALSVAYANDDPAVARDLSSRLLPSVMGQAVRMLPDRAEAEDVAQEAMMRLWRNPLHHILKPASRPAGRYGSSKRYR